MATSAGTFIVLPGTPRPAPQGLVLIELPRCCVLLPMAEFVAGLKRGKAFKRSQAFRARTAQAEEGRCRNRRSPP